MKITVKVNHKNINNKRDFKKSSGLLLKTFIQTLMIEVQSN